MSVLDAIRKQLAMDPASGSFHSFNDVAARQVFVDALTTGNDIPLAEIEAAKLSIVEFKSFLIREHVGSFAQNLDALTSDALAKLHEKYKNSAKPGEQRFAAVVGQARDSLRSLEALVEGMESRHSDTLMRKLRRHSHFPRAGY